MPESMAAPTLAIEARGLARNFGSFAAVRGIDLSVARGEVFGLLGANGAGKTTAIRMLCGTLPPSGGQVRVAGIDMVRQARRSRARIGYVTQRFTLYGDLTVLENLRLQAGLYSVPAERLAARLDWALDRLDLREVRDSLAAQTPLGLRRRLAMACSLLHEPDVLFLDEPTSGIDPLARQYLWELVYELAEAGVGVLVTTHYMDEALFCDRLALMDAGRIVAEGSPQALLARPLASPLVELRLLRPSAPSASAAAQGSRLADWARQMASWPEVREVLPRAGRLRVRLAPGTDPATFAARVKTGAAAYGLDFQVDAHPQAELEDVFVALLDEQVAV
jgi:ABC-2 type transport system ATP-binding protein